MYDYIENGKIAQGGTRSLTRIDTNAILTIHTLVVYLSESF